MSQYCVETLVKAGIVDIAFIIGGVGSDKVKEYYGDGERFGAKFTYIEQDSPRGIAHAISLCKNFVGDKKFIVFLGDNIIQREINQYVINFQESNSAASLLLCEVKNPSQFGVAEIKNDKIIKITEKPKIPSSNLAVTGIYFLTPYIFEIIKRLKPSWRNELEIADALQILIEEKKEIAYDVITDFWKDTGTPDDIIEANKFILEKMQNSFKGKKEEGAILEGKIIVDDGTIIKSGAKITGPAIIGKNCLIENNAIIGKNTSIGDNSRLSNCAVSDSIIMSNCIIDGELNIVNSIIASNSKIIQKQNNDKKHFLLGEGTQISI
jgi:glucose-1-phosphate thymidylyltransferase